MNDRIEELWSRALAGEALSADEDKELAGADAATSRELVTDQRVDGLLGGLGRARATEAAFVATVVARWREHAPAPRASAAGRAPRPSWQWAVAAAGGLVATAALAFLVATVRTDAGRSVTAGGAGGLDQRQRPAVTGKAPRPPRLSVSDPKPRPSSPKAPEGDNRVLFLDFEDGASPPVLTTGAVTEGPPRENSRFCAVGGLSPWALTFNVIALTGGPDGLTTHGRARVLRFDYWAGPGIQRLSVQAKSRGLKQNVGRVLSPLVHGAWARATVRFADLDPYDRHRRMEEGDTLIDILIVGGTIGVDPLFVDNVEIIDESP